jgi:hypothetical protein
MTVSMKIEARILVDMVVYVSRVVSENKTLYFDGYCVFPYQGFKVIADFCETGYDITQTISS